MKKLYIGLIIILAAMLLLLAFATDISRDALFYGIEALGGLSLVFLIIFYARVVRPMHVIGNGMDLLREQDFSSRLRHVGEWEADRIVDIFNRMMDELKNARLQVRERNHLLDLLVDVSPMGIIMLDFDGNISSLNPAAKHFLACSDEVIGQPMQSLCGELAQRIHLLDDGEQQTIHTSDASIYRCSRRSFLDRGFKHPFLLIESLTQDVMAAERAAYGKVIRMISHEVNNTMTGVGSIMETVTDTLRESSTQTSSATASSEPSQLSSNPSFLSSETIEDLCLALEACASRSKEMTAFITRFANVVKIPDPVLIPLPLSHLVTANQQYLESLCTAHGIHLTIDIPETPPIVDMDMDLMAQVLINIVKNSIESIESIESNENIESIESNESTKLLSSEINISVSSSAMLQVADNGAGISVDVAQHLFTPFFSTKPNGSGIGLLLIREVLTRHHCQFSLKTGEDGFTRFSICFER